MLRASLQCQVPSDPSRGASASARALAPSSPIMFSAVPGATSSGAPPSGHSSHRSSLLKQRKGWQGGGEGFGEHVAAPSRSRVLRASLQCQVPSDPSRGASESARAFAPSPPVLLSATPAAATSPGCLPQVRHHHTAHQRKAEPGAARGKGRVHRACSRTLQVQGVEGLVAVPGAVRPLPRGQRIRQSLRPLGSNLVPCSNRSSINRAPPSGHSPDTPPLFKREQGRQQQGGGEGVRRACSRTIQDQGVEGLVAVPGAVQPLPWGQRMRQSLSPLVSDPVVCSNDIIRAPPSGQSPHSSSLLKGKQSRQQQGGGAGFGEHVAVP